MLELRYTLLSDGNSDRALLPILTWLLQNHLPHCAIEAQWADLRGLNKSLRDTFEKRILLSLDLYPCELLFIHRDAEKEPHENRIKEIQAALRPLRSKVLVPTVCVVPVRMTETWLLIDMVAIREAASNPNGKVPLLLPDLKRLESIPDPKEALYENLRIASGRSLRRMRKFSASDDTYRVADLIRDFSPLRALSAFVALESELEQIIHQQRW
jgi:hypothetical protein